MRGEGGSGPIEQVIGGFGTRRAALDYAFFKVNLPGDRLALLVDFIVRRARGVAQVRVSVHAPSGDGVHWLEQPIAACRFGPPGRSATSIGPCRIDRVSSAGSVGPVAWQLAFRASGAALVPLPSLLEPLRATDMFLRSAPQVLFGGTVTVSGEEHVLRGARGMVSSYHGRALPPRWLWISCNDLDRNGMALECMVAHTHLFGTPFGMNVGYFHLRAPEASGRGSLRGEAETIVSPLDGRIRVEGTRERFTVVARRRGGAEHRATCGAPGDSYHDLGEGIRTTLVGSCEVDGFARADGTTALEERGLL